MSQISNLISYLNKLRGKKREINQKQVLKRNKKQQR